MEDADGEANRAKDAVLSDLKASLASPDDLDKVPGLLEEMQRRHAATGAALSDHISMHCAQIRTGLEDMGTALAETEAIKQRLREVRELCKKADVLGATEARHAGVMATVQANIKRTIGGVENIYKFPARATDALALLDEIDNDHTALLEVFHDLSVLLSTLSVAEEHIQQLRVQASIARIDDISKVESYFGRVQQANTKFTEKLLSYFDDVIDSANNTPRHLVMALRVVLNQETVWAKIQETAEANPWGVVYREEAIARMRQGIAKQLKPVCHEAEHVFAKWMQTHGRAAPVLFQHAAKGSNANRVGRSSTGGSSPAGSLSGSSDGGAARMSAAGARSSVGGAAASAMSVAARLIGGVGHVPIKLSSMTEPVSSAPEAVNWLQTVETDEGAIDLMNATLANADESLNMLVEIYDNVLPCFPRTFDPLEVCVREFSVHAAYMLDALGQGAPMMDNGALLALLGWQDSYRTTLIGLGCSDEVMAISTRPRLKTPYGEPIPMHGLDVARLVYIDRIRSQLAKAFKNLADIDLLKEPEPDGRGRLWTPGVIELFRFLSQQVQLAAGVRDAEVLHNVAGVALQVMQSYQGLVCSAMVEKELEFSMLIAIVNNNLIAYDQSRDLAFAIDSAIKGGEDGEERRSDGSTESLSLTLADTEVHAEMEDACEAELLYNSLKDACRGFLSVSKIALEKAVDSIFKDQGMVGLSKALYCHPEWKSGVSTQSYLLTLEDYLGDLNQWLDPPFFKRALEQSIKSTVKVFYKAFLTQMPSNTFGEAEADRMDADIDALRTFFNKRLAPDQVEKGMEQLDHLHNLVLCETADEFEERFSFMLMDNACRVKPSDVATVCSKRADISYADAVAIEGECERLYQNWLSEQSATIKKEHESAAEEEGVGRNLLANMYKRLVKMTQGGAEE